MGFIFPPSGHCYWRGPIYVIFGLRTSVAQGKRRNGHTIWLSNARYPVASGTSTRLLYLLWCTVCIGSSDYERAQWDICRVCCLYFQFVVSHTADIYHYYVLAGHCCCPIPCTPASCGIGQCRNHAGDVYDNPKDFYYVCLIS